MISPNVELKEVMVFKVKAELSVLSFSSTFASTGSGVIIVGGVVGCLGLTVVGSTFASTGVGLPGLIIVLVQGWCVDERLL